MLHLLSAEWGAEYRWRHPSDKADKYSASHHCVDGPFVFLEEVGRFYYFAHAHCGKKRDGEFHDDENARYRTEFIVAREIVDKKVCKGREVVSPRKENCEKRDEEQCPLYGTVYHEQGEYGEHKDECPDIDGTVCHRLVAEILRELGQELSFLGGEAYLISLVCLVYA